MTRRLKGRRVLGEADAERRFRDTIGMTGDWRKPGPVFFIPLRALAGVKTPNLLAAGRCISAAPAVWNLTRVIPVCAVTGEAAGTAAALAAERERPVVELDVKELQGRLAGQGVLLSPRG
jgi:hypothetical protein